MGYFLHFHPSKSPKNQNFWKNEKSPGNIVILQMCTKNYDQMMYGSWGMVCDRCNCYFSFGAIFCPFTFLTAQKIKILKKMKNIPGDIIILHMCNKNYDQMMDGFWDMVLGGCNYFIFWAIFCAFIPLTARKIKILKKWKKRLEISSFAYVYQNLWSDDVRFLRYGAWQM